MVRIDIYDCKSSHSLDKDNVKDAFDFYKDTAATLPYRFENAKDEDKQGQPEERKKGEDVGRGHDKSEESLSSEKHSQNLTQVWWEFLGETTLHGCKNVRERRLIIRISWAVAILLMAATLGWAVVNLFLRYQEHPFVTAWGFQREAAILAPGITICLPAKFSSKKLEKSMEAYQMFAYGATLFPFFDQDISIPPEVIELWRAQLQNITVTQARRDIGFTLMEIVDYGGATINGTEIDLLAKMGHVDSDDQSCWTLNWHIQDTQKKDRVHESVEGDGDDSDGDFINDDESEKEEKGGDQLPHLAPEDTLMFAIHLRQREWMSFAYRAGIDLYLHEPSGSFWSAKPLLLRPGTYNMIHYTTTKYKYLPLPYKSFGGNSGQTSGGGGGCVDTERSDFHNPMATLPTAFYSTDACMLEMALNASTKMCNCSVNIYKELHGVSECSILEHNDCFLTLFKEELSSLRQRLAMGKDPKPRCPQACKEIKFEATVSSANFPSAVYQAYMEDSSEMGGEELRDNAILITIQPRGPLSVNIEHVPEMTLLTIVGSVGGWMGLCLGASLLTLTEFFQAALLSAWILYRKLMRTVHH